MILPTLFGSKAPYGCADYASNEPLRHQCVERPPIPRGANGLARGATESPIRGLAVLGERHRGCAGALESEPRPDRV